MSLDGFIAGPNGEFDWIIMDPDIDFEAHYKQFDTALLGRRTFEIAGAGGGAMSGIQDIICSRTVRAGDHPNKVIYNDAVTAVSNLKNAPGKDIWLFGGGDLFRSLLDAQLVDTIELGVMPIMLGEGIPVLPKGPRSPALHLESSKILPSGILGLTYTIEYDRENKKRRSTKRKTTTASKKSRANTR